MAKTWVNGGRYSASEIPVNDTHFVASEPQRKGIANQLLAEALEMGRSNEPSLAEVSFLSSHNAVGAYEKLGFHGEGPENVEHGIRFIPMILRLE
jgi:predicted GNAT family N-acyltransferase